ncbi:U-megalopygitoxin(1)-Mo1-like [Anticarsia gemmatalis]|uniref:U-megalopygitoxin(1)-Mo1-like n=1 Tax=Anticarsia gemmatalis TaxID=129554 RepID=UPI003F758603
MVSKIFVIALIVGTASAATWFGKPPTKPREFADKEGCYIKEINDVVPFGTTVTPIGHCYRIHCSQGMVDYASCGVVGTSDPKCHVTDIDLSKPYPACCPDVSCDLDNNIL